MPLFSKDTENISYSSNLNSILLLFLYFFYGWKGFNPQSHETHFSLTGTALLPCDNMSLTNSNFHTS
jgi:hypothetical protein